ncbi:MAG: hypothetical protein HKL90_13360 [Elusimicrobia bacterium]|nr:hypothetical protein [Elusimicrobiota bacterium]
MLSRKNSAMLSFVFSSMLSAALLSTAPQGFISAAAGPEALPAAFQQALTTIRQASQSAQPRAVPAAFVSASAQMLDHAVLTAEQMNKIDGYNRKIGADMAFDPIITQFLGLTRPGETMTFRQFNGSDDGDTVHFHYFNRSETDPNVMIFYFLDKNKGLITGYVTNPQFDYISGYVTDGTPSAVSAQAGAAGLADEIRWWAKSIDSLPNP